MSALEDAVTGVNPPECVHVQCCGWDRCRYLPEPIGPELPPLIVDMNGDVWGRHGDPMTSEIWWYGSSRLVTWSTLRRIRAGKEPIGTYDLEEGRFPWGPWIGCDYDESVEEAKRMQAARRERTEVMV